MKLISTTLGKLLVATAAVLIILGLIVASFLPGIRDFYVNVFPDEKNHIIRDSSEDSILHLKEDFVVMNVGDPVNNAAIFDNFLASTTEEQEMIEQLKADCDKAIDERTQVFIYKVQNDGSVVLEDEIDSSSPGKWTVFFIVDGDSGHAVFKAKYVFV